jgi:hypothetical protein
MCPGEPLTWAEDLDDSELDLMLSLLVGVIRVVRTSIGSGGRTHELLAQVAVTG